MRWRSQISRPTFFASATQSSMLTPSTGMNGTTSVAPMRGCAPECLVRSISSAAFPTPRSAASATASGSPAIVTTLRLWSESLSRSSRYTPGTSRIAAMMASILAVSRPSEKFGTDSTSRFMWLKILRMDNDAALHREGAKAHTKIIRDFAIVGHVKGGDVRILANFQGAGAVVGAQRVGGVDRGGADGFGGRHAHLRARQRYDHGHAHRGAGAGIEIGGDADDGPRIDQFARWCEMAEAEMEAAAGKQSTDHVRERERANVGCVYLFQVIRAGRLQFDSEAGCAGVCQLFGVDARDQAAGASRSQDFARLRDGERAAIAEYVTELGETRHRDRGNPALRQQIHVGFGAAAIFRGNHVRAEKRRVNIERMLLMQFGEQREDFEFTLPLETVAAFRFNGCGAVSGE